MLAICYKCLYIKRRQKQFGLTHQSIMTFKPDGKFLVELRQKVPGRLQREVEDACKMPKCRLSLYENNRPISIDHLSRLAKYYNISARKLIEPVSLQLVVDMHSLVSEVFDL